MNESGSIRLMRTQAAHAGVQNFELLDRAFQIKNYTDSFPHIFLPSSSAEIFSLHDALKGLVAMCAVDTEVWSEPFYLRGACIGSVAVDPSHQRQGFGQTLLKMVLSELRNDRHHDFVYLFSDQTRYYEALGFRSCGTEVICSISHVKEHQASHRHRVCLPRLVGDLTEAERVRLWQALERGRLRGESHACWHKWQLIVSMPDMFVSWLEDEHQSILAGAFIGKGADFQGVVHTLFAESDNVLRSFWTEFSTALQHSRINLQIVAGFWARWLEEDLQEQRRQSLCMVSGLLQTQEQMVQMIDQNQLYPRALFSS